MVHCVVPKGHVPGPTEQEPLLSYAGESDAFNSSNFGRLFGLPMNKLT